MEEFKNIPIEEFYQSDVTFPDPNPIIDVAKLFLDDEDELAAEQARKRVTIIGAPGSGKTFCLKRLEKYYMLRRRMVIFTEFHDFPVDVEILPSYAILAILCPDDVRKQTVGFQWMRENSEKVVFIIDSLDTMRIDFTKQCPTLTEDRSATIDVIVHNILSGVMFPNSLVISASRPRTALSMHTDIRPDRIVGLDDLCEEGVLNLLSDVFQEDKCTKTKSRGGKG